jgi:hypothetical protein
MILLRVPRHYALRHKRLPLKFPKFPPKLDTIIRIPRQHCQLDRARDDVSRLSTTECAYHLDGQ